MFMAIYEIELETTFSSENVLTDKQAKDQYDSMVKQMQAALDKWCLQNECAIVKKIGEKRDWSIKIVLTSTNKE
jgi:hypothetical protein